jgi:hypothetical protein
MSSLDQSLLSYQSFLSSKYRSIKHTSYFQVYDDLFSKYIGKEITFVEVGVLNGGSLFMWRDFFGPKARIIGIELNPAAKKWEQDGFEIHIGSQADTAFWEDFYKKVGKIDILLDDGGHFNDQQIITTLGAIPYINDGGLIVVEDVHTSYMPQFTNPSKYSFINFCYNAADKINGRFPGLNISKNIFTDSVFFIGFYESIVAFKIDRRKCFTPNSICNEGITSNAKDFRKIDQHQRVSFFERAIYRNLVKLAKAANNFSFTRCLIGIPMNNFLNKKLRSFFK